MVLATKPKPRQTVHHKKRTGQHHTQSKHYVKTYWPYLPMIGITIALNSLISRSTSLTTSANDVSRLELWTNAGPWISISVLILAIACITIVTIRHTLAWQRAVAKSEDFFVHHHTLDVLLVGIVLASIVVTRTV